MTVTTSETSWATRKQPSSEPGRTFSCTHSCSKVRGAGVVGSPSLGGWCAVRGCPWPPPVSPQVLTCRFRSQTLMRTPSSSFLHASTKKPKPKPRTHHSFPCRRGRKARCLERSWLVGSSCAQGRNLHRLWGMVEGLWDFSSNTPVPGYQQSSPASL